MANYDEELNFAQGSDSGEDDNASIQPVNGSEPAWDTSFNRPIQNLRRRTEILRDALIEQKYFSDYDRSLIPTCLGKFTLALVMAAPNRYSIIPDQDLIVYPALTPGYISGGRDDLITSHHGAKLIVAGVPYVGTAPNELRIVASRDSTGQRGFSNGDSLATAGVLSVGANRITVELVPQAIPGGIGSISAVVSGVPARHIRITYGTAAPATTTNDLIAYINADATSQTTYGLRHLIRAGTTLGTGPFTSALAPTQLQGGLDAEAFRVTVAQIVNFFTTVDNLLQDGDGLAIGFPAGPVEFGAGNKGGRRQSLYDCPVDQVGGFVNNITPSVGDNLFNTAREPEKIPGAIPIGKMVGGEFVFVDGTRIAVGAAIALGESQAMYTALASTTPGSSGASLVGYDGSPAWHADAGASANPSLPAGTLEDTVDEVVVDLALDAVTNSGARRIGAEALTGSAFSPNPALSLVAGSLRQQIAALLNTASSASNPGGINARVSERGHLMVGPKPIDKVHAAADVDSQEIRSVHQDSTAVDPLNMASSGIGGFEHLELESIHWNNGGTDLLLPAEPITNDGFAPDALKLTNASWAAGQFANVFNKLARIQDGLFEDPVIIVKINGGSITDRNRYYFLRHAIDTGPDQRIYLTELDGNTAANFTGDVFAGGVVQFYAPMGEGLSARYHRLVRFHYSPNAMETVGLRDAGQLLKDVWSPGGTGGGIWTPAINQAQHYGNKSIWKVTDPTPRDTDNILGTADKALLSGIELGLPIDASLNHHHGGAYTQTYMLPLPVVVGGLIGSPFSPLAGVNAANPYIAPGLVPGGFARIASILRADVEYVSSAGAPNLAVQVGIHFNSNPAAGIAHGQLADGYITPIAGATPSIIASTHVIVPCDTGSGYSFTVTLGTIVNVNLALSYLTVYEVGMVLVPL